MFELQQKWKTVLQRCLSANKSEKRFCKDVEAQTKVKNGFAKMLEPKQK